MTVTLPPDQAEVVAEYLLPIWETPDAVAVAALRALVLVERYDAMHRELLTELHAGIAEIQAERPALSLGVT